MGERADLPTEAYQALVALDLSAFRQELILVTVLISQGKPDEACAVAAQVLDATQALGSYLVIQQLLDLKQLLEAHRANKVVANFLVCLGQALKERRWLCQ